MPMATHPVQSELAWITGLSQAVGAGLGEAAAPLRLEEGQLDFLWRLGQECAAQGRHEDSLACFAALVNFRLNQPAYLDAMASTLFQLGRVEEALAAFRILDLLDPFKPQHTLSVAQCLLPLGRAEEAFHLLGVVVEHCRDDPSQSSVLQRAQALRDLLRISDGHRH